MASETEVASLLVRLSADIEQYSRAIEKAQRDTDTRVSGIDRAIKKAEAAFGKMGNAVSLVNSAIAALGAGAAIGALARLGKGALDTAGALNDLSERLGVGVEKLQAFRYAGSLAGIEQAKVDSGLTKFAANIGKAAQGTGELVDTLKAYGISLRDNTGHLKTTETLLAEYADVVAHAHSQQEKLRLVIAGMGREGAGFVQLLANGSAGLKTLEANARAAGVVLDEAIIKKGDEVGDKLDAVELGLKAAFDRGFLRGVSADFQSIDKSVSQLSPQIEKFGQFVADSFSKAAQAAAELSNHMDELKLLGSILAGFVAGGPVGAAAGFAAGVALITQKTRELSAAQIEYNKLLNDTSAKTPAQLQAQAQRLGELRAKIADLTGETRTATAATEDNTDARETNTKATIDGIDADIAAMKAWDEAHKENVKSLQAVIDKVNEQIKAGEDLIQQQQDEIGIQKLLQRGSRLEAEVQQELLKVKRQYPAAWAQNQAAIEASTRAMVQQKEATRQAGEEQQKAAKIAQEAADRMATIWDEASRDMFDTWRDGWRDLLSGKVTDFKDFAKQILNIGLDLAANLIAAQTWQALIGPGMISSIGGGGGALGGGVGGGVASLLSAGGAAAAGWINTMGATYLGTGATAGSLAAAGSNSVALSSLNAPLLTTTLGGYLGVGALGGLAGYGIGSLTGMKNPSYSGIGGGVGAMAGLAIGGPVGAAVGALIGSLAGLLGPGPSDKLQGNWLNFSSGSMSRYGYDGNKYSAENANSANALGTSLLNFADVLKSAGLQGNFATNARVEVGSRESPFRIWYGGINGDEGSGKFGSAQDAFKAMAAQLISSLHDVPAKFQSVLDNIDWDNLEKFAQDLQDIAAWNATIASVRDQLAMLKDPKKYELDQLDAQFQPLRDQAAKMGEGLADIEELYGLRRLEILKKYGQATVDATADIWAAMNAAEGRRFLNDIQSAVGAHTTGLAAAGSDQTNIAWVNRTFAASLNGIINSGGLTADELNVIRNTFASIPEVVAAADLALNALNTTVVDTGISAEEAAQAAANVWQQITAAVREDLDTRLSALADERAAIEDTAQLAASFADSLHNAKLRFLTDRGLYRGTNEQRLNDLMALLDTTNRKALDGDPQARADLADIALAAAEANNAFNASSERGNEIQEKIQGILDSAESIALQDLRVSQLALQANQAQVTLLQQQLAILSATAKGTTTRPSPSAADINALNSSYVQTHNAMVGTGPGQMTEQEWVNSATFGAFQSSLLGNIAASTDTTWLQSTLTGAQGRQSDPYLGASGLIVADATRDRLHELGVPGFASGTGAGRTGRVAFVHPDEMLYTGPPARVMSAAQVSGAGDGLSRALAGLREDVRMLAQTVSLASGDQVAKLGSVVSQLSRMTGNLDTVLATR